MRVYAGTKTLLWSRFPVVCSHRLWTKHFLWLVIHNNSFPRVSLTDNIGSYFPSMRIKNITLFYTLPNFMKPLGTKYVQDLWPSVRAYWNWPADTKDTCTHKERERKKAGLRECHSLGKQAKRKKYQSHDTHSLIHFHRRVVKAL